MARDEYTQDQNKPSDGKNIPTTFPNTATFPKTQGRSSSGGGDNTKGSSTGGDERTPNQPTQR